MTTNARYRCRIERRERLLDIRGVDYCINEWGDADAPLLAYLHGWADTGSTFQFVVDALADQWHVVAPDWRGFGRTSYRSDCYWFPDYLADLHEMLEHYSPREPVRLIGHSMGGNIASLYAGSLPERVRALVNIEGFGLPDSNPDDAPDRFRSWIRSGATRPTFTNYPGFEHLTRRIMKRNPGTGPAEADFVARQWASQGDDGRICLRADPNHKRPNAILYRRAEAEACWRRISADVLLVCGDRSPFAEKPDSPVAAIYPNSQYSIIQDAGHMIHFEAAAELARVLEVFLRSSL